MSGLTTFLKLIKPDRLEKFNLPTINTNYDTIDAALAKTDALPKGILYSNGVDSGLNTRVSSKLVITHNPSFAFKAGRQYLIRVEGTAYITNTDTYYLVGFWKDPNLSASSLSQVGLVRLTPRAASFTNTKVSMGETFIHSLLYTPVADETVQVKMLFERIVGTGEIVISNFEWSIEDKGKK